ncbi:hypothetical protein HDU85_002918 [Gaertneriomyces sp. JEL0708]|nr:hypothetical protein HDU85_002918 [Gaertneriomyces sp. JEL0708]
MIVEAPIKLRTLIIDNYDSYTFNLYQYCCIEGAPLPVVIKNNQLSWEYLRDNVIPAFDCIIISPGPGRPERPEDFGVCTQLLQHADIPVLGVCLGHQGLAFAYGGTVKNAAEPVHGRLSPVSYLPHQSNPCRSISLFDSLPNPFNAVRYHSLVVSSAALPPNLRVSAWTYDSMGGEDIIQGLEHVEKPLWGVQFHPESICTNGGATILHNFRKLAMDYLLAHNRPPRSSALPEAISLLTIIPTPLCPSISIPDSSTHRLVARRVTTLSSELSTTEIFDLLYADEQTAFWLDSAKVEGNLARFSFMGAMESTDSFCLKYNAGKRTVTITRPSTTDSSLINESQVLPESQTFFHFLSSILRSYRVEDSDRKPPFPMTCGLVGYFGYEMKDESMRGLSSHSAEEGKHFRILEAGTAPDAAFIFADRMIAVDHSTGEVWGMGLVDLCLEDVTLEAWFHDIASRLHHRPQQIKPKVVAVLPAASNEGAQGRREFSMLHRREAYVANISRALAEITSGESYEVCVTTQIKAHLPVNRPPPFELYRHLRKSNPAPFGAFLKFDEMLAIASSSPERFLRLGEDRWVSMKPIKGTVARATKQANMTDEDVELEDYRRKMGLESDEKNRAENLMIVDLIRNDLNIISAPSTVSVPSLMKVESYATVHQLVTTVQGKLRGDLDAVDAVMHSFPPGSMTGAPKLRTVEILEELEAAPRGVYSGVLGYFSLSGHADFSVIIRTAVLSGDNVSVGAGGAIVALSDADEEFAEMCLKGRSVLPSLAEVYGIAPLDPDA